MKKFLVIGNPISHSLSPKLHNYWLKKNNMVICGIHKKFHFLKYMNGVTIKRNRRFYPISFRCKKKGPKRNDQKI